MLVFCSGEKFAVYSVVEGVWSWGVVGEGGWGLEVGRGLAF